MKFTLEIELGNEAMQTLEDVASAIHGIGLDGDTHSASVGEAGLIYDINGNRVGKWSIFDDQQQARIDRMAAIQRHHDDKSEDPGHHCEACPHPQDGSTCKACTELYLEDLANPTEFHCAGCGREESECSRNPCARVIADRES